VKINVDIYHACPHSVFLFLAGISEEMFSPKRIPKRVTVPYR